jgi:hypothetical protein
VPTRFLLLVIGVSEFMIAFIFGNHADIFASYDRKDLSYTKYKGFDRFESEHPLDSRKYNWFTPSDILRFPLEQIILQCDTESVSGFVSTRLPVETKDVFLQYHIVIDKTTSSRKEPQNKLFWIQRKDSLLNALPLPDTLKRDVINKNRFLKNIKVEDLIALNLLALQIASAQTDIVFSITWYNGTKRSNSGQIIETDWQTPIRSFKVIAHDTDAFCRIFNNYIMYAESVKLGKMPVTDLNEVFGYIQYIDSLNKLFPRNRRGSIASSFFFISDLCHETVGFRPGLPYMNDPEWVTLSNTISSFARRITPVRPSSTQITIIHLEDIKKPKNPDDQAYNKITYQINTTKAILKKQLMQCNMYEWDDIFPDIGRLPLHLKHFGSRVIIISQRAPVRLYHSYNGHLFENEFAARLLFDSSDSHPDGRSIGLIHETRVSHADETEQAVLKVNEAEMLIENEPRIIDLDTVGGFHKKGEKLCLLLPDASKRYGYFLEVGVPDKNYRIRYPIFLLDTVPLIANYMIVFFYGLVVLSIVFFMINELLIIKRWRMMRVIFCEEDEKLDNDKSGQKLILTELEINSESSRSLFLLQTPPHVVRKIIRVRPRYKQVRDILYDLNRIRTGAWLFFSLLLLALFTMLKGAFPALIEFLVGGYQNTSAKLLIIAFVIVIVLFIAIITISYRLRMNYLREDRLSEIFQITQL